MKISNIKSFLVCPYSSMKLAEMDKHWQRKHWVLVKVETDEGIVGWGEAYTQPTRERSIAQLADTIGAYIIGKNPFHIKHFTHIAYNDLSGRRGSMDIFCAVSAIEQAMWDIVGKKLGTPVYNLLGGPCREKIRVYANGWYRSLLDTDDLVRRAKETVQAGFTALKFDPFPGPWRSIISKEDEDIAVRNVRLVREAVGQDVDVLIEVHRRLAPMYATRIARRIEQFNPFWYEEPVPADNINALAEVRHDINLPVVTGETLYTKAAFRDILEKQAADILNPDVANCGGILELKEIAAMAEPYYVSISPHNYNSTTMALAATIQASAVMTNFLITEYFVQFAETGNAISVNPIKVENGYIALPTAPGLGLEINEEALKDYQYQNFPPSNIRSYGEEWP